MRTGNAKKGRREPGAKAENRPQAHGIPATGEEALTALVSQSGHYQVALRNAIQLWAESNTAGTSDRQEALIQAKTAAVLSFFRFSERELADVTSMDIRNWRESMEAKGHKPATVYARVSRLSSFFEWLIRNSVLSSYIELLYKEQSRERRQTESTTSLSKRQRQGIKR